MTLAAQFGAMADELMSLGGVPATLIKQPSDQTFNPTTLKTEGSAPTSLPVTIAHMKATASRLTGFGQQFDPNDQGRKLEFYYLRGADPAIGDVILFADGTKMTITALSKVDVQGVAIVYQILLEA